MVSNREKVAARIIPFNRPYLGAEELQAVIEAMESANLGGNGPVGADLSRLLQQKFSVRRAILTTSCTSALEMAAMVLGWGPGDEVILPSFAFVTAASAVARVGAQPVFAEIDEATWNLDPYDVAKRVTTRTRAIMPVHYAGQGCDMPALMTLAEKHHLAVVEDAAQAIGAKFAGRWLGTIGDIGCFSFHVTKNVICGEGGAFLTNNPDIAQHAEIICEKGTNRSLFLRGQAEKYSWIDIGSSYVLSDLLAAIARAQFAKMDDIRQQREQVWRRYQKGLADLARAGDIMLHRIREEAEPNWHIYAFRMTDPDRRGDLLDWLDSRGIKASFHFVPLHSSPYGQEQLDYRPEDLPITEMVSKSLIRLPIYPNLAPADQDYIIDAIYDYFRNGHRNL